mmetsp:Transcript_703/g.1429  ORF Transcript_703/g.1429 Transcript_703/m.1429 type:complete len:108 (+) Transcript_703:1959-2282(+)
MTRWVWERLGPRRMTKAKWTCLDSSLKNFGAIGWEFGVYFSVQFCGWLIIGADRQYCEFLCCRKQQCCWHGVVGKHGFPFQWLCWKYRQNPLWRVWANDFVVALPVH